MAKHHPDLIFCRKQPGVAIGRLCEKCKLGPRTSSSRLTARHAISAEFSKIREIDLVSDVILGLQGIDGHYMRLQADKSAFIFDKDRIDDSDKYLCESILACGLLFIRVRDFCQSTTKLNSQDQNENKVVLTLVELHLLLGSWHDRMLFLDSLVRSCAALRGGALVSCLHFESKSACAHDDQQRQLMVGRLLSVVCRPFHQLLVKWVCDGLLDDSYDEFLVNCGATTSDDKLWSTRYTIRWSMVPGFLSNKQAQMILLAGKSINFLQFICRERTPVVELETNRRKLLEMEPDWMHCAQRNHEFVQLLQVTYTDISKHLLAVMRDTYNLATHFRTFAQAARVSDFVTRRLVDVCLADQVSIHHVTSLLKTALQQELSQLAMVEQKTVGGGRRNEELTKGLMRFSRARMRRGVFKKKPFLVVKKEKAAEEKFVIKKVGGDKNAGERKKLKQKPPKMFAEYRDGPKPKRQRGKYTPSKLRPSLTPGTVVIMLAGRHKGKRCVFLKQMEKSGLLLVTGPLKLNNCPMRRISQAFVIGTKTKIDLGQFSLPEHINDGYFKRARKQKRTAGSDDADIFANTKAEYVLSDQRKEDQKLVDAEVLSAVRKREDLAEDIQIHIPDVKDYKPVAMVERKTVGGGRRNEELTKGLMRFSRARMYQRRGVFKKKPFPVVKREKAAEEKFVIKRVGGDKNAGERKKLKQKPPKRLAEFREGPKPKRQRGKYTPSKLRPSLTPGTVVIMLAGRHKGKRCVFLKQMEKSGPLKLNNCPMRRISQAFVIGTKTKIDLGQFSLPEHINDGYFKRARKPKRTAGSDDADIFANTKAEYVLSDQRKEDQKLVDAEVLSAVRKREDKKMMFGYLGSSFSLKKNEQPHNMIF